MPLSFGDDVLPLFTGRDVNCMALHGVFLDEYDYMSNSAGNAEYADHANLRNVISYLTGEKTPRMPIGEPYWEDAKIAVLDDWLSEGCPP